MASLCCEAPGGHCSDLGSVGRRRGTDSRLADRVPAPCGPTGAIWIPVECRTSARHCRWRDRPGNFGGFASSNTGEESDAKLRGGGTAGGPNRCNSLSTGWGNPVKRATYELTVGASHSPCGFRSRCAGIRALDSSPELGFCGSGCAASGPMAGGRTSA